MFKKCNSQINTFRRLDSKHVTCLKYLNIWHVRRLKTVTEKCLTWCLDLKHLFFSVYNWGVVVDQVLFGFLTCPHVPEILAIKVESCQKSLRNLDVFLTIPKFRGRAFPKLYARYHPCLAVRRLEKFHEDIPTSSEVIGVNTLNFRPDF